MGVAAFVRHCLMEAAMKGFMFEGTPEEVIQAMTAMQTSAAAIAAAAPVAPTEDIDDDEKVFVTTDMARHVFTRRPLSPEQKKVLKFLARNYPNWTLISKLQEEVAYTPAQFAGLLGAFGRRLSHTDGYVVGSWLFDAVWSEDEGCWSYKLPETVLEALKLEKLA